jgi:hypothetical protein
MDKRGILLYIGSFLHSYRVGVYDVLLRVVVCREPIAVTLSRIPGIKLYRQRANSKTQLVVQRRGL